MTWFTLVAVVIIVAVAALTGVVPTGGRPVAQTRLIGVTRALLLLVVLVLAYAVFRTR